MRRLCQRFVLPLWRRQRRQNLASCPGAPLPSRSHLWGSLDIDRGAAPSETVGANRPQCERPAQSHQRAALPPWALHRYQRRRWDAARALCQPTNGDGGSVRWVARLGAVPR